MNTGPIIIIHLVKLINQADSLVCQDERASLKRPFASDRVLVNTRSEADRTGAFTSCVNHSVVNLLDVFEELRLGCTGVSKKQHVDVATDSVLVVDILGLTAEHGQRESLFDELMPVDRRSN